jgi:hypothetical protein
VVSILGLDPGITPHPESSTMIYTEALRATAETAARAPAPGTAAERAAIERFKAFFARFDAERIASTIGAVYGSEVWFDDNLKVVRGREALERYLIETTRSVESCTVEVLDVARSGCEFYLRWQMEIRSPRLKKSRPLLSFGMSHLRYDADGRIILHRDFWDAAGGLFEHLPVIGTIIRRIKGRL